MQELQKFEFETCTQEFSDGVASGVAAIDKNGDIYYFGGGPAPIDGYAPSFIHKFSTKNFKVTKMASLSEHFWPGGSSAVTVGDSIYIIGGDYGYLDRSYIFRYHIPTNTFGIVKVLPISLSSTAAVYNGKHIYSFGGTHEFKASGIVLKFDPATLETKIVDASLPETKSGANALLVEDIVYVLGGRNFDFKLSKIAAVFNTTNESITETIVESPFPLPRSAGAVYVEKKNQIYIFGGHGETKPSYDVLAVVFNN